MQKIFSISIYADQTKCCSSSKARLTTGDESIRSYNNNFRVVYLFKASLELGLGYLHLCVHCEEKLHVHAH